MAVALSSRTAVWRQSGGQGTRERGRREGEEEMWVGRVRVNGARV